MPRCSAGWRCHTALRGARAPAACCVPGHCWCHCCGSQIRVGAGQFNERVRQRSGPPRRSCPLLAGRVLLRAQHRCPSETRSLLHRKRKRPVNVLYPWFPAGAFDLAVRLNQSLPWYLPRPSCCWRPSMALPVLPSGMEAPSPGSSHTL